MVSKALGTELAGRERHYFLYGMRPVSVDLVHIGAALRD